MGAVPSGDQVMLDCLPLSAAFQGHIQAFGYFSSFSYRFSLIFHSHFFHFTLAVLGLTAFLGGVCFFPFFRFSSFPRSLFPFSLILQMFGMTLAQVADIPPPVHSLPLLLLLCSPHFPLSPPLPFSHPSPLSALPSVLSLTYPLTSSPTYPLFPIFFYSHFSPSTFPTSLIYSFTHSLSQFRTHFIVLPHSLTRTNARMHAHTHTFCVGKLLGRPSSGVVRWMRVGRAEGGGGGVSLGRCPRSVFVLYLRIVYHLVDTYVCLCICEHR